MAVDAGEDGVVGRWDHGEECGRCGELGDIGHRGGERFERAENVRVDGRKALEFVYEAPVAEKGGKVGIGLGLVAGHAVRVC